jgi:hypothetical protein
MIGTDSSGYQTNYRAVRQDLRAALLDVLAAGPVAGGDGSVVYRAAAALYALPGDRRRRRAAQRTGHPDT